MKPGPILTLRDVLAATAGDPRGSASPELRLSSVCVDSRLAGPGALFVALRGPVRDGHAFVADAFARGAAAALVERVPTSDVLAEVREGPPLVVVPNAPAALQALARYWQDRRRVAVVAVIGSIGKATTAELTTAVLAQQRGTLHATAVQRPELDVPLALLRVGAGVSRLVLDLSWSNAAELAQVSALVRPSMVVVTNIQPNRLEAPRSPDEIGELRGTLVRDLPETGTAILNADDARVRAMASQTRASTIFYGLGSGADVRAEAVVGRGLQGMELNLVVARRSVHVRLPMLGLNSVHSALAAAGAGLADGIELRAIGAGLQTASPEPRIVVATGLNGSRIIDDSLNASPESGLEALNLLAQLDGRKVAVLGGMLGLDRSDAADHRKLGNRAARVVDALVTVGERGRLIADEARRMGLSGAAVFEAASADEATRYLRHRLRPGDYVLVKGAPELALDTVVQAIRLEG